MAAWRPAEVFPPGEFVREELEARNWTQADLAEILDRPPRVVSEIISAKRGISPDTAKGLAAAFGTSPELWLNLESAYQLWRNRGGEDEAVSRRAKIYGFAPIKDMVRRGWIEASTDVEILERRVLEFFEANNLDEAPKCVPHTARKSTSYGSITPAQCAWLLRAKRIAAAVQARPFSEAGLEPAIQALRHLLRDPQGVGQAPRILAEAGIRLVVIEPLPGTRIDGACLWDNDSPVIAMSLRFDRIDNFWFTLMHELAHVDARAEAIDIDLQRIDEGSERPETERAADAFASERLVPGHELDRFIAEVSPLYSTRKVEAFSEAVQIHPGIVVGQLQHRREIGWSSMRRALVPVRAWITDEAITDGWESTPRPRREARPA